MHSLSVDNQQDDGNGNEDDNEDNYDDDDDDDDDDNDDNDDDDGDDDDDYLRMVFQDCVHRVNYCWHDHQSKLHIRKSFPI